MLLPETTRLFMQHQQRLDAAEARYQQHDQYLAQLPSTTLGEELRLHWRSWRSRLTLRRTPLQQSGPTLEEKRLQLGAD